MNNKALNILEFNKILEMLSDCAATEGAKEMCLSLRPDSDIDHIRKKQTLTSDAKTLIGIKGHPAFGHVVDVRDMLERAEKAAVLSTRELLDCGNVLRTARALIDYMKGDRTPDTSLDEIFSRLMLSKSLEDRIFKAIVAEDFISDEASPELSEIRRKMRHVNLKIRDELQKYVSGSSKYLQENIVTTRGGRFVIPVKAEYRNEVKGLIHDTSQSGSTLFIEPMAVVEANNELRELESKESYEIERILRDLSNGVACASQTISLDYQNITEIAFIFACGELSYRMDAAEPTINEEKKIRLVRARHPLLDKKTVVPITVSLGEDFDMLVITGPNTGGKTVTLKTIGLFALMAQAGLHLPTDSLSTVCVFDEIFAEIGDEQSIEQSLSTFSSHMKDIVSAVENMTDRSLVLFDELGSGTDPVEGAALAISILEEVRYAKALCAATTHYAELKAFAIETDRVANASCEFDVDTLRPTYKLIIGTPGKSNAFAISEKLGLSPVIVERAKKYVNSESKNFENVIEKLEKTRIDLEREKEKAEKERREFEAYRDKTEKELNSKLGSAEKDSEKMMAKAREMLDGARVTSEYVYAELDKLRKERDAADLGQKLSDTRRDLRKRMNGASDLVNPVETDDEDYVLPRPLVKGDAVYHRNLGQKGYLLDEPDKKGMVNIKMGAVKLKAKVSDLKLLDEEAQTPEKEAAKNQRSFKATVSKNVKLECDVRGMTGEEAWFVVDKYIDEIAVAGLKTATIIHGKGTGALRNALWAKFKADSRIKNFRPGQYGEGDYGVTVIEV